VSNGLCRFSACDPNSLPLLRPRLSEEVFCLLRLVPCTVYLEPWTELLSLTQSPQSPLRKCNKLMEQGLKTTEYFRHMRKRPDRSKIRDEWISRVLQCPQKINVQADGRIRKWAWIDEEGKFLRVILL
jgi:hypothetical protein